MHIFKYIFTITAITFASVSFAQNCNTTHLNSVSNLTEVKLAANLNATLPPAEKQNQRLNERSGCCSHHGGVCGCQGGRAICCDGAPSPSCGCN